MGPRQIQRTHSLDVWLDPPCLGCAGNHWPVSDHPRNVGYSARERRHHLFLNMSELISDERDKANSPSIPSTDAPSCAWVAGLLRPPPPRRLRDVLLFGGGTGGAGIEIDLGVGAGVSSCWGLLGTVGRSEVVDADRVRLIEAL